MKLTRSGNLVTASESPDGDTWTVVGSDTISLPATALVGLAVSSHSTTTVASATFDNVTVGPLSSTAPPAISIADRSIAEGNAGTTNAVVTLTLSAPSTSSVTVNYATAAGTATAGTDYTTTSGTATFAPGSTSTTITVPVLGDTTVEPNETVLVNLTAPVNATIADAQAVVTITNDDTAPTPAISIADVAVNEGNAGVTSAVLTLTLSATSTSSVTVNYATAPGTATAGTDYTTTSGTATFAAGTTTTTITVPILGDITVEPTETVLVNLTAPVNATIADAQGVVTITNDDAAALPAISIADRAIAEGNAGTTTAVVTLALSAASASTVTVSYATAAGTATAGTDYTTTSGTATFTAGTTTTTITVPILGDTTVEPDETVLVNLTAPVNATIADAQAILTITDDDSTPSLLSPWQTQDIGAVGLTGSASFASATKPSRSPGRGRHLGHG